MDPRMDIPFESDQHEQHIWYFNVFKTKQMQFIQLSEHPKCHTCIRAMKRKKALAARLICSYRNLGRKVRIPYLAVLEGEKGKLMFKSYFKTSIYTTRAIRALI